MQPQTSFRTEMYGTSTGTAVHGNSHELCGHEVPRIYVVVSTHAAVCKLVFCRVALGWSSEVLSYLYSAWPGPEPPPWVCDPDVVANPGARHQFRFCSFLF